MRTVRGGRVRCFEGVSGAFYGVGREMPIVARKMASKRPQGQKKIPGNDSLSIIIPRCLCVKFIADT